LGAPAGDPPKGTLDPIRRPVRGPVAQGVVWVQKSGLDGVSPSWPSPTVNRNRSRSIVKIIVKNGLATFGCIRSLSPPEFRVCGDSFKAEKREVNEET
jgi:hypothetical protein